MRILAPTGELDIFADPEQHFRERKTFITYDNIWDTFAPIEPATVEAAHDYATLDIDGLSVSVIPLPGVTPNHTGYAITLPETGQRVAFAGEAIHSPGRMARIAPLQYDYNDLGGAVNAYWSAGELRRGRYDALMPSLGEPMLVDVDGALVALEGSLTRLCAGRPHERELLKVINDRPSRARHRSCLDGTARGSRDLVPDQRERQGAGHGLWLPRWLRRVASARSATKSGNGRHTAIVHAAGRCCTVFQHSSASSASTGSMSR